MTLPSSKDMTEPVSKQFLLPNTRQSIKSSVEELLDFIVNQLPATVNKESISFKVEVILIELLTNGIKHAGTKETFLDITVDDKSINIDKKDFGNRYQPGNITSLLIHDPGYRELLTKDGLHSMYAVVMSDTQIKFVCEEVDDEDSPLDVSNLMEHFGLLIITKASDNFTYEYDIAKGLNTFSVYIKV
jgi:anti-sigma regulatory factor (Ser/Thr protein kinase)